MLSARIGQKGDLGIGHEARFPWWGLGRPPLGGYVWHVHGFWCIIRSPTWAERRPGAVVECGRAQPPIVTVSSADSGARIWDRLVKRVSR